MPHVELSEADRVAEAIRDVRFELCPLWGRTRLLCNPTVAAELCRGVRLLTQLPPERWTDELILLSLFPAKQRPRRRT